MGRMLGAFADDEELDRPDLNKCPDCDCFFASDACPLCKKICPEEMRAGNRKPVKPKKHKRRSGSGRVQFISWYHQWWFIILLFLIMPLAGLILLITSPHKLWKKILFVAIYLLFPIILSLLGAAIFSWLTPDPVNTSLSKEAYMERCVEVDPEQYYRSPDAYQDTYMKMTLTVVKSTYGSTDTSGDVYYLCRTQQGDNFYLIVRDCLLDGQQYLIAGDCVTFWGQYGKTHTVVDADGQHYTAPSLYAAYVTLE